MKRTLAACALVLSIATLCPAPIKDIQSKDHELPVHTQAQRAEEQKYDGQIGVVGTVETKKNDGSTRVEATPSDSKAAGVVAAVSQNDPSAVRAITKAGEALEKPSGGLNPLLLGAIVFAIGFALFQAVRIALVKFGPKPPEYARTPGNVSSSKILHIESDDNW